MSPGPGDSMPNPYNRLLLESVSEDVVAARFTWGRALFGRYDVLHVHWPEALLFSKSVARSAVKAALLVLLVYLIRARRTPVIWTVHNERPHDRLRKFPEHALATFLGVARVRIHLNEYSASVWRTGKCSGQDLVIPHGIYPEAAEDRKAGNRHGLLFFGSIRPYKGVEELLLAFRDARITTTLNVVGEVSSGPIRSRLEKLQDEDDRVSLAFGYLRDEVLDEVIGRAAGVILPYSAMTNSGVALLALSRARPILAPAVPAILELQAEVGSEWVNTFTGEISAADLERFAENIAPLSHREQWGRPHFVNRDWPSIGSVHADLYRRLAEGSV